MKDFFLNNRYIISQLIGFCAMASAIVSYQQKSRRNILIWQITCTCFWTLHFLVLGNSMGCTVNALQTIRCIVFSFKDTKKWAQHGFWPVAFIALSIVAGAFTWQNIWSIMPLLGMAFATVSMWMDNPKYIRRLTVPVSLCWLVYDTVNRSVAGVCNEVFVIVSIAVATLRYDRKKQKA